MVTFYAHGQRYPKKRDKTEKNNAARADIGQNTKDFGKFMNGYMNVIKFFQYLSIIFSLDGGYCIK